MKTTHKVQIDDIIYEANVDFRNIIKCNQIAEDDTIGDYERVLGIIVTIFGDKGIDNPQHYGTLFKWAYNYISMGKEPNDEKPYFDLIEDQKYIASSFKYDYNYNPYDMGYLSWVDFYNDLANLSNSELGDCCILNRVINLRKLDLSKIKDEKTRDALRKAKKEVALKKYNKPKLTERQKESVKHFWDALGRS